MKLFQKASDGGPDSGVTGYFLVEAKSAFSIVLLHFNKGTREAYHSHAFNAWTVWLKGKVREHDYWDQENPKEWRAISFKKTPRHKTHMVEALTPTWALSFRGPWSKTWYEYKNGKVVELANGRRIVKEQIL